MRLKSPFIKEGIVAGRYVLPRYVEAIPQQCSNMLSFCKWVLFLGGVSEDAKRMCNVDTVEEQDRIWCKKVGLFLVFSSAFLTSHTVETGTTE